VNLVTYRLEPIGGKRRGFVRLTAGEFKEIEEARRSLLVATGVEEKFHFLLSNYADLERSLLELNLKHLVFAATGWAEFQDDILSINRHFANLLSAARAYVDQVDHELVTLFGKDSGKRHAVAAARSSEYDAHLGYRAMESLRNYQQHRGFAVHHVSIGMEQEEVRSEVQVAHKVTPSISVASLRRDGGVKNSVLKELELHGPLVPIMPLVREYVEGLASVHRVTREAIASRIPDWEAIIVGAMARGRNRFGRTGLGFVAVSYSNDGVRQDEAQLFEDFMSRRKLLERRLSHRTEISKHFVTSRARRSDA
jgi:hypothetical protein